jgi:hypothetical protein
MLTAVGLLLLVSAVAQAQVYSYSEFGVVDTSDDNAAYVNIWSTGITESADPDACVDTYLDDPDSNNLEWAEECSNDYVAVAYTPEVVLYHNDAGHSAEGTYHAFSWSWGAGANGCSGPVAGDMVSYVGNYQFVRENGDGSAVHTRCDTGPCFSLTMLRKTGQYIFVRGIWVDTGGVRVCSGWTNLTIPSC